MDVIVIIIICIVAYLIITQSQSITQKYSNNSSSTICSKSKICFLIISCFKYKHKLDRFKNMKDTFIIIGLPNMREKYKLVGNIIYVRANDLYFGLPEKIIMAIEAFNNMTELSKYCFFYKIDDDCQILNKDHTGLINFVQNRDYSGVKINNNLAREISDEARNDHKKYAYQAPYSYWAKNKYIGNYVNYLRGSNYILSRNLTRNINKIWGSHNLELLRKTEVFEDLMIGKVCFLLNIYPEIIPEEYRIVIDEFNNL